MPGGGVWNSADIKTKIEIAQQNFSTIISEYSWSQKVISYSFPLTAFEGLGGHVPDGEEAVYTRFTQSEIDLTKAVFKAIEQFVDLKFVYDKTGNGDIKIGHQNMVPEIAGYAHYPYEGSPHAVVVSDINPVTEFDFGLNCLIHEIGHALGLEHSHESETPLAVDLDIETSTVMSYNSFASNWGKFYPLASFMPLDILALQAMYGVSKKVTDDVYTADKHMRTIADYGGMDTIDLSSGTYDATDINVVDLKQGFVYYDREGNWRTAIYDSVEGLWSGWSDRSFGDGFYNMIIMPGSTIEKVVGSAVSDRLIGDQFANALWGGGGDDTINGGNGVDTLRGGAGNDTLRGGAGADILQGGAGADLFMYKGLGESPNAAGKFDRIKDFNRHSGDQIDLSAIDANTGKTGNQAFRFDAQGDGVGKTGQLSYLIENGKTHIYCNVDRDAKPEFHIVLNGEYVLRASDFIL
jgi:serralysin